MNFLKSLFSLVVAFATLTVSAQPFVNQNGADMLNVRAIATGTNGFGLTNLSLVVTNAGMVHATNVYWTNLSGTNIRSPGAAGGTNSVTTAALFKPVELWTDRNANALLFQLDETSVGLPTNRTTLSTLTLFVRLSNGLGTNGPIGFNIAPLWDGTTVPTSTAQDFSFVIPTTAGAVVTVATNLPLHRWPGAKSIAVRNITNQYIFAGDQAITNSPFLTDLTVVGFKP